MPNNHWDARNALEKLIDSIHQEKGELSSPLFRSFVAPTQTQSDVTVEVLERTLQNAALIVEQMGPEYLDFFERAELELQKAKKQMSVLDRVQHLNAQRRILQVKAIFNNQSLFCSSDGP